MEPKVQILIVDDEVPILNSLERCFLTEDNWEAVPFHSAETALEWLKEHSPDIIISDERMPGIKGSQFLAMVRSSHPDVPRIILTGQADQAATIRAINDAGVFRFLQKPWDNAELITVLKQALEHQRSLHRDSAIGLQLLQQKNELLEAKRVLEQEIQAQQTKLEQSQQALRQLSDNSTSHRADLLRVILAMSALQSPELVCWANRFWKAGNNWPRPWKYPSPSPGWMRPCWPGSSAMPGSSKTWSWVNCPSFPKSW